MKLWLPILALFTHYIAATDKVTILRQRPNAIIDLGLQDFEFFTEFPRDYTLYVLFTTTRPEHNCEPCILFGKEYVLVAEAAKKARKNSKVFFGVVDFAHAPQVFEKLKLNSAPMLYRYSSGKKNYDPYRIEREGITAEVLGTNV